LIPDLISKLREGDRNALAKSITLAESQKPEDQEMIHGILKEILPATGRSIRVGITGPPGVGKSTFIEGLGCELTEQGKTIAVLTIDPSSPITKGSILGDKTRMEKLSKDPKAFIRPSASRSFPGGVAHATREAILLCEAAGYEIIIVETVGVGQSEVLVKDMTDCFLLLMQAGAGDELQGIKKGIMEMADLVAITKADGENLKLAQHACAEYQHALHIIRPDDKGWSPKVITCSALQKQGLDECWDLILKFIGHSRSTGLFESTRNKQKIAWLNDQLNLNWRQRLTQSHSFGEKWNEAVGKMERNEWTVYEAEAYLNPLTN
jgi:LAO/AO transport system kinase